MTIPPLASTAGASLYDDSWHRPHSDHANQTPTTLIDDGPFGLKVTLNQWGPQGTALATLYNQAVSNWGETPCRVSCDADLTPKQMSVVEAILDGKHLSNAMEAITMSFTIEGCTRACTHELVRTRVGASFAQHGGRDNDWRHRHWTMPETIRRLFAKDRNAGMLTNDFAKVMECMGVDIDRFKVEELMESPDGKVEPDALLKLVLKFQKGLYAVLVDNGIPWQDARRILGIGHQTYIHANYNYLALKGVTAHRLEHGACDWEIDCVAQLMVREVWLKCPTVLARRLRSHSDASLTNKFATLYSWPPNGKHALPVGYDATIRTQFTRDQMPFWVLDPVCYVDAAYPVTWIPTEGRFPWEQYRTRLAFAKKIAESLGRESL